MIHIVHILMYIYIYISKTQIWFVEINGVIFFQGLMEHTLRDNVYLSKYAQKGAKER